MDSLPKKVYEQVVQEIVEQELGIPFSECEVEYSAGSSKGDNYLGVMYRVKVQSKKDTSLQLSLIAKLPPQNESRREQFSTNLCFERECGFYDKLYVTYKKFQQDKDIDVEVDGFHHVPRCYRTLTDAPNEALFFEDLKARDFEMFDRFKNVTKEQVFLVMRTLAKMHALSFAIQDQSPELIVSYKEMEDFFLHQCNRPESGVSLWFDTLKKQGFDALKKSQNPELVARIEEVLKDSLETIIKECVDSKTIEPYAAISHGDCWNNNMMYRYNETGEPIDIRFLDFQIVRYASPVCDLMYYIFGCTRKALRDKHYREFMDVYYEELSSFIRRLGSDPDKVYPRDVFEEQLKKFGRFGLVMALVVLPIFTSDVSDIPEMDDVADKIKDFLANGEKSNGEFDSLAISFTSSKTIDIYEARMLEVYEDMFELGYV